MRTATRFHRDGTVTYWSVYGQVWIHRAWSVPDRELAAMSRRERERVIAHLQRQQDRKEVRNAHNSGRNYANTTASA